MAKANVLFLCTGNSARSQIAEALLRHHAGEHFEVHSAGLKPQGINPYTVRVMAEWGLDLSEQRSKSVREYLGHKVFAYLITVCAAADKDCPSTFPGISHRLHWGFDDPAAFLGDEEATLQAFRVVRDQIDARLRAWLLAQGLTVAASLPSGGPVLSDTPDAGPRDD